MARKQTRTRSRRANKRKSGKWRTILGTLLILVAIVLFALDPIKNYLIETRTQANTVANISREQIQENENKDVTFDFDAIENIDTLSVLLENFNPADLPTIGGIAMPQLGMNLPINKGTSNEGMYLGAGTLYPDQVMGQGNYSLASHHSIHEGLLFQPLMNAEYGQKIYITDKHKIYEYEVDYIETVDPTRVDLIAPTDEAQITLITCDYGLVNRLVVQGKYLNEYDFAHAPNEALQAFAIDTTVPTE